MPDLNEGTIAEAYRRFPDSETDPVYAGACRFAFLEGYRFVPTTVYVVMGNDFPSAVYDSEDAAERHCQQQREMPEAREHLAKYKTHKINWRVYQFEVQRAHA